MADRGSADWRYDKWGQPGTPSKGGDQTIVRLDWPGGITLWVNEIATEAFECLGLIFESHGYAIEQDQTGAYVFRNIDGTDTKSSHSWGTAVDVNWRDNPDGPQPIRHTIPIEAVADIVALRTAVSGAPVFRWGGDWDRDWDTTDHDYVDPMHFEIIATPQELQEGIVMPLSDEDVDRVAKAVVKRLLSAKVGRSDPQTVSSVLARTNVRVMASKDEHDAILDKLG